jgi:hypothetical protein
MSSTKAKQQVTVVSSSNKFRSTSAENEACIQTRFQALIAFFSVKFRAVPNIRIIVIILTNLFKLESDCHGSHHHQWLCDGCGDHMGLRESIIGYNTLPTHLSASFKRDKRINLCWPTVKTSALSQMTARAMSVPKNLTSHAPNGGCLQLSRHGDE